MEEPIAVLSTYGFCFASAIYIVWSHPHRKGVLCGAFTQWLFTWMGMVFLVGRYGTDGPGGAMIVIWFLTGGFLSLVFCSIVAALRRTIFKSKKITLAAN